MDYIIGFIAFPILCFLVGLCFLIFRSMRWGWWDTATAFEAGLKPGFSKWNWAWVLPKLFFRFTWKDFVDRLHGSNRVA